MKIDKFELLGFVGMEPISEEDFREEMVAVVEVRGAIDLEDFNKRVIELTERLLWTRQEIRLRETRPELLAKRRAQAKAPRTWCDAECVRHQFHAMDGTPINYVGDPVPVSEPYRYDPKEDK